MRLEQRNQIEEESKNAAYKTCSEFIEEFDKLDNNDECKEALFFRTTFYYEWIVKFFVSCNIINFPKHKREQVIDIFMLKFKHDLMLITEEDK